MTKQETIDLIAVLLREWRDADNELPHPSDAAEVFAQMPVTMAETRLGPTSEWTFDDLVRCAAHDVMRAEPA